MVYTLEDLKKDSNKFIEYCKQCGFCTSICPVLEVGDYLETYGPRGRLLQIRGLVSNELEPTKGLSNRIYCTLCGFCEVKCIASLKLTDLYIFARKYLTSSGLTPEEIKLVLNSIINNNNPYSVEPSLKSIWVYYLPEKPPTKASIVYWAGCTSAIRSPETSADAYQLIKLLSDSDVAILSSEPCCGWPLYLGGDIDSYRPQLSYALNVLRDAGAELVITTCPACTRSLRDKAKELGIDTNIKINHMVEWLYQLKKEDKLPELELEGTITYHDPCELVRHMKIVKEPREIINSINKIKLIEMKGNKVESDCCGGGGLYQALHMVKAHKIASLRLKEMPQGVKVLVSACPSCKMTLEIAARNEGLDTEVIDIVELVMKALKVKSENPYGLR